MQNQPHLINLQDLDLQIDNYDDFIECTIKYNSRKWIGIIEPSDLTSQIINLNKFEKILRSNSRNANNNFTFQLKSNDDQTNLILYITYEHEFFESNKWNEQIIFKQKLNDSELSHLIPIIQKQQTQINELIAINEQMNLRINEQTIFIEQMNLKMNQIYENNQYFRALTGTGVKHKLPYLLPKKYDKILFYISPWQHGPAGIEIKYCMKIDLESDGVLLQFDNFTNLCRKVFKITNKYCIDTEIVNIVSNPHDDSGKKYKEFLKFIDFD